MATKPTGEEETEDDVKTSDNMVDGDSEPETSEDKGKEGYSEESGSVKVPEEFQKEAMALVSSCKTMACLDFLSSEVSEMRSKMMSTEKKSGLNKNSFSSVDMPESE